MRIFTLTILVLLIMFRINAQMSLQETLLLSNLYKNMEYIQYKPVSIIERRPPTYYGTAAVLFTTFWINQAIIGNGESKGSHEFTTRKVGRMYVAGFSLTLGVFMFENRKARWDKFYDKFNERRKRTY